MEKLKALFLDDDPDMIPLIQESLPEMIECSHARNMTEAMNLLLRNQFHLLLVDLNLGEAEPSGFDFLQELKEKEFVFIPSVLVITSSDKEEDEIRSHDFDALEFIKKPIRTKVLKSQLEKHCRRFLHQKASRKFGPLMIDEERMEIRLILNGKEEQMLLTLKEYKLLLKLIATPGRAYTREQLFLEVWNSSSEVQSRTIDMHVSALRKKLGPFGDAISSIRGVGYSFDLEKITSA